MEIQKYATMTNSPHLFAESEVTDLNTENILTLLVNMVSDIYGEDKVDYNEFLQTYKDNHLMIDKNLISFDD